MTKKWNLKTTDIFNLLKWNIAESVHHEAKNYIHTAECEEIVLLDNVFVFSDLSHAWVISLVSNKALVDLFSQSGVLLWSPKTQEKQSRKLGEKLHQTSFCVLKQGFHTCGNGLQGTPWVYRRELQSALPDFPSFSLFLDLALNCRRSTWRLCHPGRTPAMMTSI